MWTKLKKAEIGRRTYYDWLENDPGFRLKVKQTFEEILEDAEELLNMSMLQGNAASIRYFLDRRHPDYMPRKSYRKSRSFKKHR